MFTKPTTVFEISKVKEIKKYFYYEAWLFHHIFNNSLKYENEEIMVVFTFLKSLRLDNAALDTFSFTC